MWSWRGKPAASARAGLRKAVRAHSAALWRQQLSWSESIDVRKLRNTLFYATNFTLSNFCSWLGRYKKETVTRGRDGMNMHTNTLTLHHDENNCYTLQHITTHCDTLQLAYPVISSPPPSPQLSLPFFAVACSLALLLLFSRSLFHIRSLSLSYTYTPTHTHTHTCLNRASRGLIKQFDPGAT